MSAAIAPAPISMLSSRAVVRRLKSLVFQVEEKYHTRLLGIFGSVARGEQNENSDLDILVRFERGATLLHLSGLKIFLEENLGCKVDLADEKNLKETYKPFIFKDLIKI